MRESEKQMPYSDMHGTKKLLFDTAVELFAEKSYDAVSIKHLADACGLSKSSVYGHFASKQELLDAIYDYYCEYATCGRKTMEQVEPIIRNGSVVDIINSVFYEYPEEHNQRMLSAIKIIQQRAMHDERAAQIAKDVLYGAGIKYTESICERAIEMKRLGPFDTHALAVFCNNAKIALLVNAMVDRSPERIEQLLKDEQTLVRYAAMMIPDLVNP